jgi:hypothetical protein
MTNSSWLGPPLPSLLLNMKSEDVEQGSTLTLRHTWPYWTGGSPLLVTLLISSECSCPSFRIVSFYLQQKPAF